MRFRGAVLTGSIAALAWLAPGVAQAAAPANDALAAAAPISAGQSLAGTLTGATANPADPIAFQGANERNVWYSFAAPGAGTWTFDVCGTATGQRPSVRIYDNAGPPPAPVGTAARSNCDGQADGDQQTFTTTAAQTVRFMVSDSGSGGTAFTARLSTGPATQALVFKPSFADARALVYAPGTGAADATCAIDLGALAPCNSSLGLAGLAEGPHVLHAIARDASGNPDATPLALAFDVDHTPPDTAIPAIDASTPDSPVLNLTSPDPKALFECSVDGLPYGICLDGDQRFRKLCAGTHTFSVRAMDAWSNVDPTPATRAYTVPGPAPCGTPAIKASAVQFSPGSPFGVSEVSLDTGGGVFAMHMEYGPTSAYGFRTADSLIGRDLTPAEYAGGGAELPGIVAVGSGGTVHYRAVAVAADGTTIATDDQTATAPPVPAGAAVLTIGTPVVTQTTADIPFTTSPLSSPFSATIAALYDLGTLSANPVVDAAFVASDGLSHAGTFHLTGLSPGTRYELDGFAGFGPLTIAAPPLAVTTASPPAPPGNGGGGGGGGGTQGPGPGTGGPKPPVKAKNPLGRLTLPKRLLVRSLKARAFKPKLACKAACRLRIRLLKGKVTIALGTARRTKAGTSTITVKPTVAGRRAIKKVKRGKKLKLVLLAEALDASGKKPIGSIKRTVTFR